MTSFEIEIDGQKAFNVPIVIAREMPQQLLSYMSSNEWNYFCDTIDAALEPAMDFKKNVMAGLRNAVSIIMLGMLVLVGVAASGILTPSDPGFIGIFLCWPVLIFVVLSCFFKRFKAAELKIKQNVANACAGQNGKTQGVTFMPKERITVHHNTRGRRGRTAVTYIECTVPSASIAMGNAPAATSIFDSMASGFGATAPASSGGGRSAAERLQELEGIKALISEEEYNNKKNAILAQL